MPSPSSPCRQLSSGRVQGRHFKRNHRAEEHRTSEGCPMEIDCHRHGGYVIWLGRATGAGWSYVVTPTAAPLGPPDVPRGEDESGERSGRRPSPWRAPGRGFGRPASKSLSNPAEDTWPVLTPREGGPHDAMFVSIQPRHPRPRGAPDGKPAGRHLGPGRRRDQFRQPRHAELLEPQPDLQRPGAQPEHAADPGPGARPHGPAGARGRVPAVPGGRARGGPPGRDALPQSGVCRRGRWGRRGRRRASA